MSSQQVVIGKLIVMDSEKKIVRRKLEGKILITSALYPEYDYGDVLLVECLVEEPRNINNFDYRLFLQQQEIYGVCRYPDVALVNKNGGNKFMQFINRLRTNIELNINKAIPEPEASLLAGIVLGVKRGLPDDLDASLKRTGTTHIVVVSGANITFVLLIIMSLSVYLGKNKTLIIALVGVLFYVFLVGFDPPVLRALFMFLPILLAKFLGRDSDIFSNVLFAASIILFSNPLILKSISFQLSFFATLGLILLVPIFRELVRLPSILEESFLVSFAAQLMTLPIIVYNFHEFSIVSLFVNLLVIPMVPLITYGGFLFIVLSWLSKPIAVIFSLLLYIPLNLFTRIVTFFGNFSFSSLSLDKIPISFVFIYYFILGLFIIWHKFSVIIWHKSISSQYKNLSKNSKT